RDIDIRPVVPAIRVPTLVLHRTGDRMMRVEGARYLAQRIPGATYVELAGDDHWWWVGETDSMFARITAFLNEINHPPTVALSPRTDWELATLVLAEFASEQRTGDSNGQALHEQVRALVRREVAHYRGREVTWTRNPVLAAFDGPSRAIHCVVAIRAAVREHSVSMRAGVHTGECVFSDDEVSGVAVQIAAGVLSSAESAEVLVSSTLKE